MLRISSIKKRKNIPWLTSGVGWGYCGPYKAGKLIDPALPSQPLNNSINANVVAQLIGYVRKVVARADRRVWFGKLSKTKLRSTDYGLVTTASYCLTMLINNDNGFEKISVGARRDLRVLRKVPWQLDVF